MSSPKSSKTSVSPKPLASPLTTLMQLHPLTPPRFPTLSELAQTPSASPASSNTSGLFCSLVNQPELMLDDLLRHPEKYEERESVSAILHTLLSGRQSLKDLPKEEMEVLDRATLDLNRSSSAKPEALKPKAPKPIVKKAESRVKPEPEPKEDSPPEDLSPNEELIPDWLK